MQVDTTRRTKLTYAAEDHEGNVHVRTKITFLDPEYPDHELGDQWMAEVYTGYRFISIEEVEPANGDDFKPYLNDMVKTYFGGLRAMKLMLGASTDQMSFCADNEYFQFSFKGCGKANKCQFSMDRGKDCFSLAFYSIHGTTCKEVAYFTDLWDVHVQPTFQEYTGLEIQVPVIRNMGTRII